MTHDRMTGAELQTVREYLGLTTEALAAILGERYDQVREWEGGTRPIPDGVREEVEGVERYTTSVVRVIAESCMDQPNPAVAVYRTDDEMHAALPALEEQGAPWLRHLTACWWRHVVARAAHEVPGLIIGTRAEILGVVED